MNEAEILEAAIGVVERTEVYARMGGVPDFRGCSVEFIATTLVADDERFNGRSIQNLKWDIAMLFYQRGTGRVRGVYEGGHGATWGSNLWTTLSPQQWRDTFVIRR